MVSKLCMSVNTKTMQKSNIKQGEEKKILNLAMEKLMLLMRGQVKVTKEETFSAQRSKDGYIELDSEGSPIMIKIGEKVKTENILPDEKTIHFVVKSLNKELFGDAQSIVDNSFKIIHEVHNLNNKDDNSPKGEQ
jgi:hypothetical protein